MITAAGKRNRTISPIDSRRIDKSRMPVFRAAGPVCFPAAAGIASPRGAGLVDIFADRPALGIVIGFLDDLARLQAGWQKEQACCCCKGNVKSAFHVASLSPGYRQGKPPDRLPRQRMPEKPASAKGDQDSILLTHCPETLMTMRPIHEAVPIPDEGLGPAFRYPEEEFPRTRRRVGKGQARGVTGGNHTVIDIRIEIKLPVIRIEHGIGPVGA